MDRQRKRLPGGSAAIAGHEDGTTLLLVLCALDAALQILALVAPHPYQGMGVLAFALLPAILVYQALLVAGAIAGVPLAVFCFWRAGGAQLAAGTALLVLTATNAYALFQGQQAARAVESRQAKQATAFDAEVAKCADALAQQARDATAYFSAPARWCRWPAPTRWRSATACGFSCHLSINPS